MLKPQTPDHIPAVEDAIDIVALTLIWWRGKASQIQQLNGSTGNERPLECTGDSASSVKLGLMLKLSPHQPGDRSHPVLQNPSLEAEWADRC